MVNSNLVKGILDVGNAILKGLNTPIGAAITQLGLLSGVLIGLGGMLRAGHFIDYFTQAFAGFKNLRAGLELSLEALTGFSKTISLTAPKLLLIATAIAGIVKVIDVLHVSYKEAAQEVENLKQEQEEMFGAGSRYEELISKQEELNALEREELQYLQSKLDLQNEQIRLAQEEAYNKWQESYGRGAKAHIDTFNQETGTYESIATTQDVAELHNLYTELANIGQELQSGALDVEDFHGVLNELLTDQVTYVDELEDWKDKGFELSETQDKQIDLVKSLLNVFDEGLLPIEEFGATMATSMKASGMSAEEAVERAGEMVDAVREIMETKPEVEIKDNAEETKADIDAVGTDAQKIADAEYKIWFSVGHDDWPTPPGGKYHFAEDHEASGTKNAPGGPTLVNELGPELISANGEAYIAGGGKPTITDLPKGAIVLDAKDTKQAFGGKIPAMAKGNKASGAQIIERTLQKLNNQARWEAMTDYYKSQVVKQQGSSQNYYSETSSGGGASAPSGPSPEEIKKNIEDQTKAYKEQIKILEHKLFLAEKEGKSEEERIDQIKKIQAELEKQKEWYYAQGLDENSSYIQDLEKQWWKYEDELKDLYKDQANVYELLFSAVAEKAQGEIDILEKRKQEIQSQNDKLEDQIELEKALDELAKAKQTQKLVYKDGRMQYVQDVDAVSSAQQRVDEIKRRDQLNEELSSIDKEIEKWEEYKNAWGSVTNNYDKQLDLLLLDQKLGIKLEGENWETRLDSLEVYVDKYINLMAKANAAGRIGFGETALSSIDSSSLISKTYTAPDAQSLRTVGASSNIPTFNSSIETGQNVGISIQNFSPNLPNVTNGEEFANYMKNNFWRETLQMVKA